MRLRTLVLTLAVINAIVVGGSLYWQDRQEAAHRDWPVVEARIVSSEFVPQPGLLAELGRPVYHVRAQVTFQPEGEPSQTATATFAHHSLLIADTDRLRNRLLPGRTIRIRQSPYNHAEAYIPRTHSVAASEIMFSLGLLLLIPTGMLYVLYRLTAAARTLNA